MFVLSVFCWSDFNLLARVVFSSSRRGKRFSFLCVLTYLVFLSLQSVVSLFLLEYFKNYNILIAANWSDEVDGSSVPVLQPKGKKLDQFGFD